MRRILVPLVLLATVGLVAASCGGDDSSSTTTTAAGGAATGAVTIGALLDLSGDGASLGQGSKAALEAAVTQAKAQGVDVTLDVRDTGGDPATALKEIQSLQEAGVTTVIGPQTSSEAKEVLSFADEQGMLVISQSSTASTLAIPGDALYRMIPTDQVEGVASGDLIMVNPGPRKVVIAHRDDSGNAGLATAVSATVTARGGTVVPGTIVYPAEGADYAAVAQQIADAVAGADGEEEVVVYLAGFGEVADILAAASTLTGLADTAFYGGDGSAQSEALITDTTAAAFAAGPARGYPSPLPTIAGDAAPPSEALTAALPEPEPLAYGAYDALLIVIAALQQAGFESSGAQLRDAFAAAANGFAGVSGPVELDAAGDRATMPFAFWGVCDVDGAFEWRDLGDWVPPQNAGEAGVIAYMGCLTGGVGSGAPTP